MARFAHIDNARSRGAPGQSDSISWGVAVLIRSIRREAIELTGWIGIGGCLNANQGTKIVEMRLGKLSLAARIREPLSGEDLGGHNRLQHAGSIARVQGKWLTNKCRPL